MLERPDYSLLSNHLVWIGVSLHVLIYREPSKQEVWQTALAGWPLARYGDVFPAEFGPAAPIDCPLSALHGGAPNEFVPYNKEAKNECTGAV